MSDLKAIKLPVALVERLSAMGMAERGALIARALSAPVEPPVEARLGVETKAQGGLPERGELVPGSPGAGSPVVVPKTVRSVDRSGFGGPAEEWVGAVVHLPDDCRWFLSLDDASRAAAVRASLARARDRREEREERLAGMSLLEGVERPPHFPKNWEPVTVWVPAAEACWPVRIQDLVERSLGMEKRPGSFDLEAFIAEKKAKAAEKLGGAS